MSPRAQLVFSRTECLSSNEPSDFGAGLHHDPIQKFLTEFIPLRTIAAIVRILPKTLLTSCRWAAATICPSPPSVGAEAPSAAEHTAT